ncbi:MAG: two-component sensor histidine kinase [Flammeovirgaceae bacterium TMED32]|nr:MAG: two-component sensor histidine kinase [Flammeovirgaceae bacterium TMED32]
MKKLNSFNVENLAKKLFLAFTVLAIGSGIGTYTVFAKAGAAGPNPNLVIAFLYLNLVLMLVIGVLVAYRLVRLWSQRRQGLAGTQLHTRLVMLFSFVAVIPTIVVAVFSVLLFDFGMRSWFSERIGTAVDASQVVAESYLEEHRQNIRGDALAMANDLNRDASVLNVSSNKLAKVITAQATIRDLAEVVVFESSGKVLARTGLSLTFDFEPFPEAAFQRARAGEVATITSEIDRIRAIIRLNNFVDTYLYVGRFVDPEILAYIDKTKRAAAQYRDLEGKRFDIQITFALIFSIMALLLLFAAVWVGLTLATRLATPIGELMLASRRISSGDLTARVSGSPEVDELDMLGKAFNNMTHQLQVQRDDLIAAHQEEDNRRRFTEAVLGGVSAGVIGLNHKGIITLPNRSAASLLGLEIIDMNNKPLGDVVPEMLTLFDMAKLSNKVEVTYFNQVEALIELTRADKQITLLTRITAEVSGKEINGFVVTFDDISELQSAQRVAAWGDVARRIAHEIKNPLTPIQLAAERLQKKYLPSIDTETDLFITLTDTIVRQVEDIGSMVDEFSSFARMPRAVIKETELVDLVKEQVSLQETAHSNIDFFLDGAEEKIPVQCDARQIRQVITNLLQNSVDSITTRKKTFKKHSGKIKILLSIEERFGSIQITDNGNGLPKENRHRLTEPYVTTREKGTGLGLAIVAKILEDHRGSFRIEDGGVLGNGATATIKIPKLNNLKLV